MNSKLTDWLLNNSYENETAQKAHMETSYTNEFVRTIGEEDVLRGEIVIRVVRRAGDFITRE
jgi:hypothetical protein